MILNRLAGISHSLLRIAAGLMFLCHGGQKLLGWFGGMAAPGEALPPLMLVAGVIELVGGALIMLGWFTQPVAFIASGEMAFAYFKAHAPNGLMPIQNHGESAALFCFIFLFLAGNGAGAFSIDAMMKRKR